MPHTPPLKNFKKELLNDERFFRLLGEQNNYVDATTSRDFYMSFVQLITSELRTHEFLQLPYLGKWALVQQKSRLGWVGKTRVIIGNQKVLKFYPDQKLRRYFNNRQNSMKHLEVSPPRQDGI